MVHPKQQQQQQQRSQHQQQQLYAHLQAQQQQQHQQRAPLPLAHPSAYHHHPHAHAVPAPRYAPPPPPQQWQKQQHQQHQHQQQVAAMHPHYPPPHHQFVPHPYARPHPHFVPHPYAPPPPPQASMPPQQQRASAPAPQQQQQQQPPLVAVPAPRQPSKKILRSLPTLNKVAAAPPMKKQPQVGQQPIQTAVKPMLPVSRPAASMLPPPPPQQAPPIAMAIERPAFCPEPPIEPPLAVMVVAEESLPEPPAPPPSTTKPPPLNYATPPKDREMETMAETEASSVNTEEETKDDFVDLEMGKEVIVEEPVLNLPPRPPSRILGMAKSIYTPAAGTAVASAPKSVTIQNCPRHSVIMSPIAMCFDRMLGAAEYIKTPNTAAGTQSKKRGKKALPLSAHNGLKLPNSDLTPFEELADDHELERLVILQMAMHRQHAANGGSSEEQEEGVAARPATNVISEGFFWREFPAAELVLYQHMERYYEISAIQRNYKVQQYFNNVLVQEVRDAAAKNGFTVDPAFDDKKLRDRIRCFYKTHLQNAKKRLATLQKHSDSIENQSLVAVYIRCARNPALSFQDSLEMAPPDTIPASKNQENHQPNNNFKKRRLSSKLPKLKGIGIIKDTSYSTTTTPAVPAPPDAVEMLASLQGSGDA